MGKRGAPKEVSRREFVKGAAGVAGVAAVGALASCVPVTPAAPAPAAAPTLSTPVPQKWDEEVDVVVVGTGVAGYAAAIEAKDAGASVTIIEKEKWYGGNSLLAGGNMQMPASHIQKAAGIEDKPEWAYEDVMIMGEHRNAPELVKLFVNNAADTALWMEKLGVVWQKTPTLQEGCRVPRSLQPQTSLDYARVGASRGISFIKVFHKAAGDRNIPVRLGYKMTRILRPDPKGPVVGIEAVADGKTVNIKARKAVLLATGGFKANRQMIRAWHPLLDEEWSWSGAPYVHTVGDGHLAVQAIGGGLVDMSFVLEFSIRVGSTRYAVWDPPATYGPDIVIASGGLPLPAAGQKYVVLVENDGNRYVDESKLATGHITLWAEHTVAFLNLPKRPRKAWAIADAEGAKALGWTLATFQGADPNKAPFLDPKYVATGNTLAELAGKMEMPAANLAATMTKYNGFVTAGADNDFKRPAPLYAISQAPFFAARLALVCHDQCAGIRVNDKLQVIDQTLQAETGSGPSVGFDQERVIPHLYAAGECTGGTFGADRGSGKMGSYTVQGRFAGKNAAAERPLV